MKLEIEVTAEDIEKGQPHKCRLCPVARAIQRRTGATDVFVNGSYAVVNKMTMTHSTSLREFIAAFDNGEFVVPGRFTLETKE